MPFIMITVLIDMISIGVIVPVLPALVGSFTSSSTEQTLWYGAVAFAFAIANFFGSPVLGALSDRYGRRPVLLLGFCGLALNFFATALATALWMLIVVRLFGGAMQSNAAVANAYVADITPPEDRAKRFGLLGSMFGLGFILGPVLGGLLGAIDLRLPFFAAANARVGEPCVRLLRAARIVAGRAAPRFRVEGAQSAGFAARAGAVERRRARWWPSSRVPVLRSSCSTPRGCFTRHSSSAGGRWRTAGRLRWSVSRR